MNTATCPICRKPSLPEFAPFCSRGCRDRDLLQWLGEGYRLPVRDPADGERDDGLDSGGSAD